MKRLLTIVMVVSICIAMAGFAMAAWPNGASTVTNEGSTTYTGGAAASNAAIAGNVTELSIDGSSITQSWAGYYGNVSGGIMLADGSGNNMYNWSAQSPEGEVFASTSAAVSWGDIVCASVANMNALETAYNISATDADGVNETFDDAGSHTEFFTASKQFADGDCPVVKTLNSTGSAVFEEVLLYDGTDAVFASLISQDTIGFNGNAYDFQMLVLEDGHGADTNTETYHFYVELE